MALSGELIDDRAALAPYRARWDALAVARGRPYCAPDWQLAWWQHARPQAARLRVVVVLDGDELVGVAPFYCQPTRPAGHEHILLAATTAGRVEPLAVAGRERDVAGAVVETLARSRPRATLLRLSQIPADSPWPSLLRDAWPGGTARTVVERSTPAPTLELPSGDLDAWLATKSSNFRSQVRRARRALEASGASFRLASGADVEHDVAAFVRLHLARWEGRGGSTALTDGMDRMLVQAADGLVAEGRLRLASIEVDGRTVGSLLFLAAGGEVSYWNGGYDEAFARQRPTLVGLVEAVGWAQRAGDSRLDLGPGDQEYKARLADGADELLTVAIVGPRAFRASVVVAAVRARGALAARLNEEQRSRARDLVSTWSPGRR